MELNKLNIMIKDPIRKGFQTSLKYIIQDIGKHGKVHIAEITLDKPRDVRFYILKDPEELKDNKEFLNFKKEGRIKDMKIHELVEKN